MKKTIYSKVSDQELVSLFKKGDQIAYTEIFERYSVLLYHHASRMLNDEDEANDVIQDVFVNLWQRRESLILKTSLSSYLYTAVRNRIFDLISHQKVALRYIDSIRDFMLKGNFIVDEEIRLMELTAIIDKEINALPPKMREVFKLSRQEFTHKEIGQKLNISDNTVRQQVHNAVKILKARVSTLIKLCLLF